MAQNISKAAHGAYSRTWQDSRTFSTNQAHEGPKHMGARKILLEFHAGPKAHAWEHMTHERHGTWKVLLNYMQGLQHMGAHGT